MCFMDRRLKTLKSKRMPEAHLMQSEKHALNGECDPDCDDYTEEE